MPDPDIRERLYADYAETGAADVPLTRPEDAPGGQIDMLRATIARHFPPSRDALIVDLGCGPGLLVHFARQAGYGNISGVDVSPSQVAAAQRLGIEGISQGALMETLDARDAASLDAVVTFDVLEHLTGPELLRLADGVYRALRPGGRWIIHTVNAEAPFFGRVRYGDLTHQQAFTRTSIRQMALAAGFTAVTCHEDAPVPGRPGGTIRWLMWRLARWPALFWLIAESGAAARHAILSQNLLAVAER